MAVVVIVFLGGMGEGGMEVQEIKPEGDDGGS